MSCHVLDTLAYHVAMAVGERIYFLFILFFLLDWFGFYMVCSWVFVSGFVGSPFPLPLSFEWLRVERAAG
jgi:hypothetical protein